MVTVLILLNICHWLGDYTHLSTKRMLDAKRIGNPLLTILSHAATHAGLMGLTLAIYIKKVDVDMETLMMWSIVILIQLVSHFIIDVLKGKLNIWFPRVSNPSNKAHWYVFGLDQLLHQLIIILMAYLITK